MTPEELSTLSLTRLAAGLRSGQLSSEDVTRAYLDRIEAVNPKLNAVVLLRREAALREARAADLVSPEERAALHGVPVTIKDSLDTSGIVTTGGTKGRTGFVPSEDATVVRRLRGAGAIVMGKTNTPDLTLGYETTNLVYGRTNNPFDPERTSGGSSGGAAAIVAAGGSPLDVGTDTGGSIRLPAHFCGIAGLKPTAGRVPRTGHIIDYAGASQFLTHVGPLARRGEDLVLALRLIAGPDGVDAHVTPLPLPDPDAAPGGDPGRGTDLRRLHVPSLRRRRGGRRADPRAMGQHGVAPPRAAPLDDGPAERRAHRAPRMARPVAEPYARALRRPRRDRVPGQRGSRPPARDLRPRDRGVYPGLQPDRVAEHRGPGGDVAARSAHRRADRGPPVARGRVPRGGGARGKEPGPVPGTESLEGEARLEVERVPTLAARVGEAQGVGPVQPGEPQPAAVTVVPLV